MPKSLKGELMRQDEALSNQIIASVLLLA